MTGLELIAFATAGAVAPLGLGITQGVMAYNKAQDEAAATRANAGRQAYADESNAALRYQRALKFRSKQLAESAASGMDIGGSPLVLAAETLAIASEESAQTRREAMVRSQLAENAAQDIETAGKIGLFTGVASGVINQASFMFSAANAAGSLGGSASAAGQGAQEIDIFGQTYGGAQTFAGETLG